MLKSLSALRRRCPALADGQLFVRYAEGGVLCYERRAAHSALAICLNRTAESVQAALLGQTVTVPPYSFEVRTA